MPASNYLLVSQATGYLATFMLSLCAVVPLCIHMQCFRGHCLLFTTGQFADDGNFIAEWASSAYCIFTIVIGCLMLLFSMLQSTRLFHLWCKSMDSSFLSAFLDCIATLLLTIGVFIASILVTIGFKSWCEAVMQRFPSCNEASVMEIDKADKIQTEGFYMQIGTVQFAVWGSWVCWVFLTVLSVLKLCRYHERELMTVSMARARQSIIRHTYEQRVESADDD